MLEGCSLGSAVTLPGGLPWSPLSRSQFPHLYNEGWDTKACARRVLTWRLLTLEPNTSDRDYIPAAGEVENSISWNRARVEEKGLGLGEHAGGWAQGPEGVVWW